MRERLEWSDVKLLWAILVFLDTQNWHPVVTVAMDSDAESESSLEDKPLTEVLSAAELITTTSQEPLEAVGVSLLLSKMRLQRQWSMHETIFQLRQNSTTRCVQALRFPRRYQAVKCPSPLRTVFQPSVLKWQCGMNVQTCQDWPQDKASSGHTGWPFGDSTGGSLSWKVFTQASCGSLVEGL